MTLVEKWRLSKGIVDYRAEKANLTTAGQRAHHLENTLFVIEVVLGSLSEYRNQELRFQSPHRRPHRLEERPRLS